MSANACAKCGVEFRVIDYPILTVAGPMHRDCGRQQEQVAIALENLTLPAHKRTPTTGAVLTDHYRAGAPVPRPLRR